MVADIIFFLFTLYGLVFGLRRGFYKELVAFTALVVAVAAARTWRDPAGDFIVDKIHIPASVSRVAGAMAIFVVVFLIVNIVGRFILKRVRDPDRENVAEKAADELADAIEGKDKPGPVTLLTNPVARAHKSVVYWSDKLLGGLLGIVKGAAATYAIFAVVYFVDLHAGHMKYLKDQFRESHAKALYSNFLEGWLRQLPEYRVFENAGKTELLVERTKGDPALIDKLAALPAWAAVKQTPAFQQLAADPEIQALWTKTDSQGKRDLAALLDSPKVRHLFSDPAFEAAFADADVDSVHQAMNPPQKKP
ncbi:MAG TPA: CvpA family protein [Planctomycetota bacterium]|nr:CvpA family protein [Planctomycetota bacterium]